MDRSRGRTLVLLLAVSCVSPGRISRAEHGPSAERVRQAALATYPHGITADLAANEVGAAAVPHLVALLGDPAFPRRDNVVAFLAFLGDERGVEALLDFLGSPPSGAAAAEEDRALLLAPHALGHLAASGLPHASEALLEMTAPGSDGGILQRGAVGAGGGHSLRDDLLEQALHGLALSATDEGVQRLADIGTGRIRPAREGRDLGRAAERELRLMASLSGPATPRSPVAGDQETPAGAGTAFLPAGGTEDLDAVASVHDTGLDYANHVDQLSKMTDVRLDALLREASLRAGRDDYDEDLACCITVSRRGGAGTFGSHADGLDVIDNAEELTSVVENDVAWVKVVRLINWCGEPGMNIIGCAPLGFGMVVVRVGNLGAEAVLWIHEYGHNTGLGHAVDPRDIMYSVDDGANNGLTVVECNFFHFPSSGLTPTETGACTDDDADAVQDGIDNCPLVPNNDQQDRDNDWVGDACDVEDTDGDGESNATDNCPVTFNPDQTDSDGDEAGDACDDDDDNDGVADVVDNCPLDFNPDRTDTDGDGLGDACDPCSDVDGDGYGSPGAAGCAGGDADDCDDSLATVHPGAPEICDALDNDCDLAADEARCEDFDIDADLRAGGSELSWLGRAFGECGGIPALEWWRPVDYTADGCIDGEDLAILAFVWNCRGPALVCAP